MKTTLITATAALLLASTTIASPNHLMIFDCVHDGLGDVCDNMCFGAFCQKWGESFTWDKPSKSDGDKRSTKAGCGSRNRCSKSPYGTGYQCDEYPFKSVKESDAGGQVNRCVKSGYNNAQSQVIRQFYNSQASFKGTGCGGTAPCSFNIVFANAGLIDWCDSSASKCKNDGNEFTKAGKVPDPSKRLIRRQDTNETVEAGGTYLLQSGQTVVSAQPLNVGDRAVRVKRYNETLYAEYNEMHILDPEQGLEQYDYMMPNLYLEEDVVVEKV